MKQVKIGPSRALVSSIPRELKEMIDLSYGYSLLIKGDSGVGKTLLALELLISANILDLIYISTRVAPIRFSEKFDWVLDEARSKVTFIDATQAGTTLDNPMKADEMPKSIRLEDMPTFIQQVIKFAEQSKGQTFLVIDSWDAIQIMMEHKLQAEVKKLQRYDLTENLNFMYNALITKIREKNIKLVLISENVSNLDYLVDAIVELKRINLPGEGQKI
ncbi:MAG: RAD55 family ATPase, partial [Promethearchaeota archaeon]